MSEKTQLDNIETTLSVMNQKINFLIGGILGTPFKDPLNMTVDDLKKETKRLVLDTEEREEGIEAEHEAHVKSVYEASMASDIVNKILENQELTKEEEWFIFDHYDEMQSRTSFAEEGDGIVLNKKFTEVVNNVKS